MGGSTDGRSRAGRPRPRPHRPARSRVSVAVSPAFVTIAAGRQVAEPQARAAQPRRPTVADRFPGRPEGSFQVVADPLRTRQPAGDVVTDVGDDGRPRRRREERVERGHAIGLGRGHGQPAADVVERRLADPADPRLDRVECRQQTASVGRASRGRRTPHDRPSASPVRHRPIPTRVARAARRPPPARPARPAAR